MIITIHSDKLFLQFYFIISEVNTIIVSTKINYILTKQQIYQNINILFMLSFY